MKSYPSIPKIAKEYIGRECVIFRKYDGSCISSLWTKKKGWHRFSTRNHLFDSTDKHFGSAVEIFNRTLADTLTRTLVDKYPKATEVIAFAEFLGPHSFAGIHDPVTLQVKHNDPKKLVLFDINIHKKGMLSPQEFVDFVQYGANICYAQDIANIRLTDDFIKDVREGKYSLVGGNYSEHFYKDEGVVVKGGTTSHNQW